MVTTDNDWYTNTVGTYAHASAWATTCTMEWPIWESALTNWDTPSDEDQAKIAHGIWCRRRDLGYLYRPKIRFRLHFVRKPPRVVHQPCWSSKLWRSVT